MTLLRLMCLDFHDTQTGQLGTKICFIHLIVQSWWDCRSRMGLRSTGACMELYTLLANWRIRWCRWSESTNIVESQVRHPQLLRITAQPNTGPLMAASNFSVSRFSLWPESVFLSIVNLPCVQWKCPSKCFGHRSHHKICESYGVTLFN